MSNIDWTQFGCTHDGAGEYMTADDIAIIPSEFHDMSWKNDENPSIGVAGEHDFVQMFIENIDIEKRYDRAVCRFYVYAEIDGGDCAEAFADLGEAIQYCQTLVDFSRELSRNVCKM